VTCDEIVLKGPNFIAKISDEVSKSPRLGAVLEVLAMLFIDLSARSGFGLAYLARSRFFPRPRDFLYNSGLFPHQCPRRKNRESLQLRWNR
jgi:hypothetical protein